jgi:tRNA/rRNA methyltransferase
VNAADKLKNIRIVLCGTSHPGNIGAAARAMKTMGLAHLWLVNPQRFPDPEAEWRASRAADVLARARVCASLDEALRGVALAVACSARSREVAVPQVDAREAARQAVDVARAQQAALVFGNETNGLTTADVNRCGLLATIPANPEYASLNLAAAVQVFAYELRMAAAGDAPADSRVRTRATHDEVEHFYAHLEKTMIETGYFNPDHPKKLMPRLRRLFARAQLEKEEVNILRGLLKSFQHPRSERNK